jgi:hypothetical protein
MEEILDVIANVASVVAMVLFIPVIILVYVGIVIWFAISVAYFEILDRVGGMDVQSNIKDSKRPNKR